MTKDTLRIILISLFALIATCNYVWIPRGIKEYPKEPIWPYQLADPFAFEANGRYYIVGTGSGSSQTNDTFPALVSTDLLTWTYVGDILYFLNEANQTLNFWAPHIVEKNKIFYLFYTLGFVNDTYQIRVASSNSPLGPYYDKNSILLTNTPTLSFAIDPYIFHDTTTDVWYLFYSRNYFDTNDGYRMGVGIAADRLINNMTALAGNETMIIRPKYDWQLSHYNFILNNRSINWYTLEGPVVWQKEPGVYVFLYSGSNWQNATYGVDYAISLSSPLGPYIVDVTTEPRLLRTKGDIIGPGHNSIILGRDRRTTYTVYHAWNKDRTFRLPYVSQLDWKRELVPNSSRKQDFLHVALAFSVYFIVILLIFQHAL